MDDKLRLGVAYYPECFPPEQWPGDIERMVEAGINTVRLGEFAWARMEPEEGTFDLDWLEEFVELAGRAGIETMMCTPTEAPPPWLTWRYEDVLPVDEAGLRRGEGGRRHYCVSNPTYQQCSDRVTEALGTRFGPNRYVVAWQLDNEAGCHDAINCYCEHCQARFRHWLRDKYESIEALNDAWYTSFWSHNLIDFEHVVQPTNSRTGVSPQQRLDWIRFGGQCWIEFLDRQTEILRPLTGEQLITHNITWYGERIDMYRLTERLDRVGIDIYQREPYKVAMVDAWFAAIKKDRPFWVMEMPAGISDGLAGSQRPLPPAKLRSYFLRHYLRGAGLCSMWHFRRHHGGQEMFHGACIDHNGRPSWAFEGLKDVGRIVAEHGEDLLANRRKAEVAILHSYDDVNLAALHGKNLGIRTLPELDELVPLLEALDRRGIGVTFARPTDDLAAYKAVFAPQTLMTTAEIAGNLAAYVRGGGVLVGSGRIGQFDEQGKAHATDLPGHLVDLFGARLGRMEEAVEADGRSHIDARLDGGWGVESLACRRAQELVPADAKTVAVFESHRLAGAAAGTVREAGSGKAILLGVGDPVPGSLSLLLEKVLAEASVDYEAPCPPDIERIVGDHLTGYINICEHEMAEVKLPAEQEDLLTGERISKKVLSPHEVLIVRNG